MSSQFGYSPQAYSYPQNTYVPSYNPSGYNNQDFKRVNGLEIFVVLICIIGLVWVFSWGLITQNTSNRDKQRQQDISQIISALDEFYKNSNLVPSQRSYPKAVCSEKLNEVDFEFLLRENLTGKTPQLDTHAYISPENFPKDKSGTYSQTLKDRKVEYRCPEKLPQNASDSPTYIDNYPSCNFKQSKNYVNCYIYTSTNNGDTFRVGYFSESISKFVIYKRFREGNVQFEYLPKN